MTIKTRVISGVMAAGLLGGVVAVAAPAGATVTDRGTTQILTCDDVSSRMFAKDSTKHGLDNTVRSIKVSGIKHEEGFAAGDPNAGLAKREPDPANTPDLGDTDSCSGPISSNLNNWNGNGVPYGPNQQIAGSGVINEVVKVAGSLTGRATCDSALVDPSEYALHGKLIVAFGNQGSVGTPGTPTSLDTLGKPVQGQVYVTTSSTTYQDLININGMGIKGMAEGAWFDTKVSYRPPAQNLAFAIEACATFADDQVVDGIIGEPPFGGLVTITTDTDADTGLLGNVLTSPANDVEIADRDNSFDWSI